MATELMYEDKPVVSCVHERVAENWFREAIKGGSWNCESSKGKKGQGKQSKKSVSELPISAPSATAPSTVSSLGATVKFRESTQRDDGHARSPTLDTSS